MISHKFILKLNRLIYLLSNYTKIVNPQKDNVLLDRINSVQINDENESWYDLYNEICIDFNKYQTSDFCNFPSIKVTMFFNDLKVALNEIGLIKKYNFFKNTDKIIKENNIGNPKKYNQLDRSSANLIHHFYHINFFIKIFGHLKSNNIIEFGSGYGSMCRIVSRCYKLDNYYLIDNPVFLHLSKYFLENVEKEDNTKINFKFYEKFEKVNSYCFISTWALSETNKKTRNEFEYLIKDSNEFIIAFYKKWGNDIDNVEYFNNLQVELSNHKSVINLWSGTII